MRGKVALHYGGDCTLRPGTAIFEMLFSVECSNREGPPFHAENEREAIACAKAASAVVTGLDLSVDGGPDMDLFDDEFATSMPIKVISFGTTASSTTQGSALYDSLDAAPKNFIAICVITD